MDQLVYQIVAACVRCVRALPLRVCYALGGAIGALLWWILPRYRKLAARNLEIAFGKEKSRKELERLTFEHFKALGANGVSALKLAALPFEEVRKCVSVEGMEIMKAALAKGRGVVMAISHIGNWELFAQLNSIIPGLACGTVYQPLRNKKIDRLINGDRERLGVKTFDRRKGFHAPIALLREGGLVGVLIDQHAGDSGVWTPFFGRLASTSPLAAALAARTGAEVIPVAIYSDGFAHWRAVVRQPVAYDPEQQDRLTLDLNRELEAQIRESPKDWFWVHNRWKTPLPYWLLRKTKRGIFLDGDAKELDPFRIVIRTPNWLGDAVMAIPAVRAIASGRPDAHVSVLCPQKLKPLWESVPEVKEILAFEAGESVFRVAGKLRRKRFDVGVAFPNSIRTGLELWLGGVPRRVGYPAKFRDRFMNQIPKEPKKCRPAQHLADRYLWLAKWLGAEDPPPSPARGFPRQAATRIGVCPGAEYGPAKRWPVDRFAETMKLADAVVKTEWRLLGVAKDASIADEIKRLCGGLSIADLCGKTDLRQLMDELLTLDALLTNDTGTMHLAAFLGVPVVAVFGSTEPKVTGPRGGASIVLRRQVECSPCYLRQCPLDFRCMLAIEPQKAAEALLAFLGSSKDQGPKGSPS